MPPIISSCLGLPLFSIKGPLVLIIGNITEFLRSFSCF